MLSLLWKCAGPVFGCALSLFSFVLFSLWQMAASALRIKDLGGELFSLPSMRLQGFLATVIGSWIFFPGAIFGARLGYVDVVAAEKILIYANFMAKVRVPRLCSDQAIEYVAHCQDTFEL